MKNSDKAVWNLDNHKEHIKTSLEPQKSNTFILPLLHEW